MGLDYFQLSYSSDSRNPLGALLLIRARLHICVRLLTVFSDSSTENSLNCWPILMFWCVILFCTCHKLNAFKCHLSFLQLSGPYIKLSNGHYIFPVTSFSQKVIWKLNISLKNKIFLWDLQLGVIWWNINWQREIEMAGNSSAISVTVTKLFNILTIWKTIYIADPLGSSNRFIVPLQLMYALIVACYKYILLIHAY